MQDDSSVRHGCPLETPKTSSIKHYEDTRRSKPSETLQNGKASGKEWKKEKIFILKTRSQCNKTKRLNVLLTCCSQSLLVSYLKSFVSIKVVLFSERQAKRMPSVAKILMCHNQRAPARPAPVMSHW